MERWEKVGQGGKRRKGSGLWKFGKRQGWHGARAGARGTRVKGCKGCKWQMSKVEWEKTRGNWVKRKGQGGQNLRLQNHRHAKERLRTKPIFTDIENYMID